MAKLSEKVATWFYGAPVKGEITKIRKDTQKIPGMITSNLILTKDDLKPGCYVLVEVMNVDGSNSKHWGEVVEPKASDPYLDAHVVRIHAERHYDGLSSKVEEIFVPIGNVRAVIFEPGDRITPKPDVFEVASEANVRRAAFTR